MKYSFKNDYAEGAHPRIIERLSEVNLLQQNGYGLDEYSLDAEMIIKRKMNNPAAKVYLVSGGTQANLIIISAFLRPHESVVAANTGHIFTNESGAIEATGHKVHGIENADGKIRPEDVQKIIDGHQNMPHQVKQKMVYISNSTELGTIYSKTDLIALYEFCQTKNLFLFVDGARLGHALTAETNDLTLEDFGKYCDAFYLGGTKNGALIGEAIVINNIKLHQEFGFHLKQKGALLAKGRLLGIQFQELLKDDLYFNLASHANQQAMKIKKALQLIGCEFLCETFTNQIFPILNQNQIDQLSIHFDFYVWKKLDNERAAVRLITSWATTDETVTNFINEIIHLK